MRKLYVLTLVVMFAFACCAAQASTIYKITFDVDPANPGPSAYVPGPGDIIPAGMTNVGLDNPHIIATPAVAGYQGGNVLDQPLGATWPNQQGYRFGGDGVRFMETPGPVVANVWTLEAVVKPDFTDTGFGQALVSCIVNAENLGDGYGGGDFSLLVDQTTGYVKFSFGMTTHGDLVSSAPIQSGQWYHIAVVARAGVPQRTELWINGQLDATGAYPAGWETQALFKIPGYFNVGSWYWSTARNWQGQIDAIAISDTALAYGSFVLPTSYPPVLGGNVTLANYQGDPSMVGVEIQLRAPGTTTPAYTDRVFLDQIGNYSLSSALNVQPGLYDVAFKTATSLREVIPGVLIPGSVVNATLVNGDLDGNNYIGTIDHSILSGVYDTTGDQ